MPRVPNPFAAPRRWDLDRTHGDAGGCATAPAGPARSVSSAVLPRLAPNPFAPASDVAAEGGRLQRAVDRDAHQDPAARGLRRAASATAPPAPDRNAGAARTEHADGAAAVGAYASPSEAAREAQAPPAPAQAAGGGARGATDATPPGVRPSGAAGAGHDPAPPGTAPGEPDGPGEPAGPDADSAMGQGAGLMAAVRGPPPPPPALPFLAHAHKPFEAGPGEGAPALPPLWPSSAPPAPPPPALPFLAQHARRFDAEDDAPGSGGVAAGTPACGAAGSVAASGWGAPGGPAADLTPSSTPPSSPPPALPFVARAHRGFNRQDSNDSMSGERARVLPPLLPARPRADGPTALPFAAHAAAGFPPAKGAAADDAPLRATAPRATAAADAVAGRSGTAEAAQASAPALRGIKRARAPSDELETLPAEAGCERAGPSSAAGAADSAGPEAGLAGKGRAGDAGGGGLRAATRARGGKEGLEMPAGHALWLTFEDAALEEKFRAWHSLRLSKVRGARPAGVCLSLLALPAPCSREELLATQTGDASCQVHTGRQGRMRSLNNPTHGRKPPGGALVRASGACIGAPAAAVRAAGRGADAGAAGRRWTPSAWALLWSSSCGWASASRTAWHSTRRSRTSPSWRCWA